MRIRLKMLNPTHWVYVLVHGVALISGLFLYQSSSELIKNIGASVAAAGITGWVVFVYIWVGQDVSERLKLLTSFGFLKAFEGRSMVIKPEYDERLQGVKERIDIMGFGLRALRQDYYNQFADWKRRANVRILLLHPDSPGQGNTYADQRDAEEQNTKGTIRADVIDFLRKVEPLVGVENGRSFQVRLYTCLPSVNIFRVDDELFWGPYLVKEQSRNTPTFIVSKQGIMFGRLVAHFEAIWDDDTLSKPVPWALYRELGN